MKYFSIIIFVIFLHAKELGIDPTFTYTYQSDSEKYHIENAAVHDFEVGILGKYSRQKLTIQTQMAYHLIHGINNEQSQFTSAQGLHFSTKDPGLGDKQKNYYVSNLKVQYGDSNSYISLNKWDKQWGPGVRSLTVSNKIPAFPHFCLRWTVTDQIHFEYFHGQLISGIVDSSYLNYFASGKSLLIMRNIVGHRLNWKPYKKWIISISELVIYANRSLEMAYLLPFIPFFPVQNYLNDTDNILMSVDVQYFHQNNIRIYGAFLMDEWSPPYTFKKDNHNWFGWQTGMDWKDIYLQQDRFRLEYTWTDHRMYHHRFEVNDVYSWGYPVGFWAGPHAEEIYADYSFSLGGNQIEILISNTKRGEYTDSMRIDQYSGRPSDIPVYERFGTDNSASCGNCVGTVESKQLMRVSVYRKFTQKLDMYVRYSFIDWENAGFEPKNPSSDDALPDISKHSIGIGLHYSF